jgi:hypothetical protein
MEASQPQNLSDHMIGIDHHNVSSLAYVLLQALVTALLASH